MSFGRSIGDVYSKSFVFSERAIRSEFWWYLLFISIIGAVVVLVPILGAVWCLVNLLPLVAVSMRRLHDTDRTFWWLLLPVVPMPVALIAL